MRTCLWSIAAVVLWGVASGARAQSAPPDVAPPEPPTFQLPPGAKVRVATSAIPGAVVEGRVTSSTDDALGLLVASDDDPFASGQITIPRSSVNSLQMSMGKRNHLLLGLLVGTASFAAIGAFATVDPSDCGPESTAFCSRGEAVSGMAVIGMVLGGAVGAAIRHESWQNVSVEVLAPRSTAGRTAPRGRGAAVAAQVAFRF